jgi:hypothetical protein
MRILPFEGCFPYFATAGAAYASWFISSRSFASFAGGGDVAVVGIVFGVGVFE